MKQINLIHPEKSDRRFDIITFPDGEKHIKFHTEIHRKEEYNVLTRITSSDDLFILMQVGDILNTNGVKWTLTIPYLMGMRMDRIISFQEPFTLRIVADVINTLKPASVSVFHPHSERTLSEIKNSVEKIASADEDVVPLVWGEMYEGCRKAICLPDKGACLRKESEIASFDPGYPIDIIILNKLRDLITGRIMQIDFSEDVDKNADYEEILILDDLCDAGGTFVGAAELLRKTYPHARLGIYVKHMVNPVGIANLSKNYDEVYTTNSYKDWDKEMTLPENVRCIDVISDFESVR